IALAIEPTGDRPAIDPRAAGQYQPPDRPIVLREESRDGRAPARVAPRSDETGGAIGILEQFAVGQPYITTDAQDMSAADRRAQLNLAADPGRRRVAQV